MTDKSLPPAELPRDAQPPDLVEEWDAPPAVEPPMGAGPWRRYWSALMRRKALLFLFLLVGAALGSGAAYLMQPEYLAEATLWVESETGRPSPEQARPYGTGDLMQSYDWVDLLRSYAVLEHVVMDQRLYLRTASAEDTALVSGLEALDGYTPGEYELRISADGQTYLLVRDDTAVVDRGAPGGRVGAEEGLRWSPPVAELPPGRVVAFELVSPRDAARELAANLDVRMLERGRFMRLELRGPQPERLTATVNAIAERFAGLAVELREGRVDELLRQLQSQLQEAQANLRTAEAELQAFRTQYAVMPLESQAEGTAGGVATNPARQNLFDLMYERDRLQRDRQALERLLADSETARNAAGLLESIPSVASSPTLMGLLEGLAEKQRELRTAVREYTEEHPDVQALRADIELLEAQTIPSAARRLAGSLAQRERELDGALADGAEELRAAPPLETERARLQRTARIAGELYTTLMQRFEEVRLASESTVSDVRIVDRAVAAGKPITDNRLEILLFTLVGCVGVGVAGVLLFDRIDPRIRYPEEVSRGLGITILGTIPHLKLKRKGGADHEVAAEAMEAFRSLRLNVSYAYGTAGPLVAAITSPGPGEGKSFVTMNLGLSFARMGYRTLICDADVRRGRLHRSLGLDRRPGLMDYLVGSCGVEQALRSTSHPGLDLLPCGVRKENAPELLATERMRRLFADVRQRYQVVLFDTPPLGAGVDPLVLAVAAGSLLVVFRAGTSLRTLTEQRMQHLGRMPVRILGAVMNDVPPSDSFPYYYTYLSDYSPTEEEEETVRLGSGERTLVGA